VLGNANDARMGAGAGIELAERQQRFDLHPSLADLP
jgi:hypothetical protein